MESTIDKIRRAIARNRAKKARDDHLAALGVKINGAKLAHQRSKPFYKAAMKYTHGILARGQK